MLYLEPPYFVAFPGAMWTQTFRLEIPSLPPGTICTIDALDHLFADGFPAHIHNQIPLEVILTPPWADGDYYDTYTATEPGGTPYVATLHVKVSFT